MHDDGAHIAPAADLAADTPVVFERGDGSSNLVGFPWLSLVWGAIAGVVGSGTGAVALGLWYQAEHSAERAAFDGLAESFFTYMLCTGALAGAVIRLGVAVFERWPVVAAVAFGAIAGLGPGAVAAREFGMQPLPFVGVTGIAIATVPMIVIVATINAYSDTRRRSVLGPIVATIVVGGLLALVAWIVAGEVHDMPPLVEVLRLYLFVGLERVGAALGALVGAALGLAVGLTVQLHRWIVRFTSRARPASALGSR
jgi:hypothetical protein